MKKWVERYEHAKASRQRERASFHIKCGPHVPYPHDLRTPPKDMDVSWLHEEMERAKIDKDMHITSQEWEYGQGCLLKVSYLD